MTLAGKVSLLGVVLLAFSACSPAATEAASPTSTALGVDLSTAATSLEASGETNSSVSEPAAGNQPIVIVPIGISLATTKGCSDCIDSFVGLFADSVESQLGRPVEVDSRVLNNTIHPEEPIETEKLASDLREWDAMREAISKADIVVIVIGFDDTAWGRFDDPCGVAPDFPIVAWSRLTAGCMEKVAEDHRRALDSVLTEIDRLRAEQPTAVRVVTVYNSTIGDTVDPSWDSPEAVEPTVFENDLFVEIECQVASAHGAECADVYHVFNGSDGRTPAGDYLASDYTHLNQRGHDAVASVLSKIGLAPLR